MLEKLLELSGDWFGFLVLTVQFPSVQSCNHHPVASMLSLSHKPNPKLFKLEERKAVHSLDPGL